MIHFLRWGVVSTSPNHQAGGPPLVGCPRLLKKFYILSTQCLYMFRVNPTTTTSTVSLNIIKWPVLATEMLVLLLELGNKSWNAVHINLKSVLNKVTLSHFLSEYSGFSLVNTSPAVRHTHFHLSTNLLTTTSTRKFSTLRTQCSFGYLESWKRK
jgi:hypothetical protein